MGTYSSVEERWRLAVCSWRESGLSGAAFCRGRGISPKRFYMWRKRLSSLPEASPSPELSSPEGFVQVQFPEHGASTGCGIAVVLGDGTRLELSSGFDAGELARAVRALRGTGAC